MKPQGPKGSDQMARNQERGGLTSLSPLNFAHEVSDQVVKLFYDHTKAPILRVFPQLGIWHQLLCFGLALCVAPLSQYTSRAFRAVRATPTPACTRLWKRISQNSLLNSLFSSSGQETPPKIPVTDTKLVLSSSRNPSPSSPITRPPLPSVPPPPSSSSASTSTTLPPSSSPPPPQPPAEMMAQSYYHHREGFPATATADHPQQLTVTTPHRRRRRQEPRDDSTAAHATSESNDASSISDARSGGGDHYHLDGRFSLLDGRFSNMNINQQAATTNNNGLTPGWVVLLVAVFFVLRSFLG
ncbi:hypothetical protein F4780DRAFT_746242 [Xylariomycetidae sp. FL0641]|nr:hypothetical protein F4780DRAFT_746242 [Xylariomycetidae sp. FL0641]